MWNLRVSGSNFLKSSAVSAAMKTKLSTWLEMSTVARCAFQSTSHLVEAAEVSSLQRLDNIENRSMGTDWKLDVMRKISQNPSHAT